MRATPTAAKFVTTYGLHCQAFSRGIAARRDFFLPSPGFKCRPYLHTPLHGNGKINRFQNSLSRVAPPVIITVVLVLVELE